MKNAHLRFGWLTYVKSTEKTTTRIKLRLDRFFGRVRCEQRIGSFGPDSAGKLGKRIHLGLSPPRSRDPRNSGLGRLVRGRTANASGDHARARHRM
jgi:hypothetical protein